MRIILSEMAEADLDALVQYIAEESVQNALLLDGRVRDRIRALADFPQVGRTGRFPDTHELVVPHDHCVVEYQIQDDFVFVLRIIHGGQEWPLSVFQ